MEPIQYQLPDIGFGPILALDIEEIGKLSVCNAMQLKKVTFSDYAKSMNSFLLPVHRPTMTNTSWAVRKLAYYDITYLLTSMKYTLISENHTFNLSSPISNATQTRPVLETHYNLAVVLWAT